MCDSRKKFRLQPGLKIATLGRMLYLLRQNYQALLWSIKQWKEAPLFHAIITITLTIGLLIPMSFVTIIHVMNQYHPKWHYEKQAAIYLTPNTPANQLNQIVDDLNGQAPVASLNIIPAKKGLERMAQLIQMPHLQSHLDPQIIPIMIQINFKPKTSIEIMKQTTATLKNQHQAIELIRINETWMHHIDQFITLMKNALLLILGLITWLISITLYCCMKQLLLSQKKYIELLQLLGASKHTIRRYFYYISIEITLCAGLVATIISNVFVNWLFHQCRFIMPSFALIQVNHLLSNTSQCLYGLGLCIAIASIISYLATHQLIKSNQAII